MPVSICSPWTFLLRREKERERDIYIYIFRCTSCSCIYRYISCMFTLWLFDIAVDNGPFIDDFPSYKPPFIRDFPWLCWITRWYLTVSVTIYVPIVLSHVLRRTPTATCRQVDRASLGAVISAVAQAAAMAPWIVRGSDHWIIVKNHDRWGDLMVVNGVKKRELMIMNGG